MKTKEHTMTTQEIAERLKELIEDFNTGYISNPSARAEAARGSHYKFLKSELLPMVEKQLSSATP